MNRAIALAHRPRGQSLPKIFARWSALHRQRAALARLDDAALKDIGINREDAMAEAARPVWDAPANWKM